MILTLALMHFLITVNITSVMTPVLGWNIAHYLCTAAVFLFIYTLSPGVLMQGGAECKNDHLVLLLIKKKILYYIRT